MRTARSLAIVLALTAAALVAVPVQQAAAGPRLAAAQTISLADGKAATFVRVELEKFDVRVLTPFTSLGDTRPAPEGGRNLERMARGFFLKDYVRRYGAVAVAAGGYIDDYSPPTSLGFVKSNGATISPAHNSWLTESVFCSDAARASVELVGKAPDRAGFRDCLQAGPILLLDGAAPTGLPSQRAGGYQKLARSVQEHTFVCTDAKSRVLVGVTDKIDLPALLKFLRRAEIGCVDAMRLTGLDTAGLLVGGELFGNDDYLFPNVIGVIPRKP